MSELLIYLLVGSGAGLIAGLFGVGGGLVIVPVLATLFAARGFDATILMHLAIGTSLATIVLTSLSSIWAHHRRGAVRWPLVWQLLPGIVIGTALGALLANQLATAMLRSLFALFELLVALQMALAIRPDAQRQLPPLPGMVAAGSVIGGVSALMGIGGGTLTVPFLLWCRVVAQQAVATAAACGLPIAVAGTLSYVVVGWGKAALPAWSSGYLYWPALAGIAAASVLTAPIGARLAHHLDPQQLRRLFALFLALLGLYMLWS